MLRHASVWETQSIAIDERASWMTYTRWIDICAPLVRVREQDFNGRWAAYWGGVEKWEGHTFTSAEDAKQAVDVRLRQLGYILPEDEPREIRLTGQRDAQALIDLQAAQEALHQAQDDIAKSKERLAAITKELAERTAQLGDKAWECRALLAGEWYGPWTPHYHDGTMRRSRPGVVGDLAVAAVLGAEMSAAMQLADQRLLKDHPTAYLVGGPYEAPQPAIMWCPKCNTIHVDVGDLTWQPHRSHECHSCKHVWPVGGPGEFYVGIAPAGAT